VNTTNLLVFIILPSDKNLGPSTMNHEEYITQVMTVHLPTPTYIQLTPTTARNKLNDTRQLLFDTFHRHKNTLSQAKQTYFIRSFKNQNRTPIFYGMPKVHKIPIKLRPVVSCINILLLSSAHGLITE